MMGITQHGLDVPIIKGITGVLFLSREDTQTPEEFPCVRCAKCVDICPVNLLPTEIMRMVKYSRWRHSEKLHSDDCVECGACAYACPSKIPLVQYIKLAKRSKNGK
jgi:electron transport complex protein RnfC